MKINPFPRNDAHRAEALPRLAGTHIFTSCEIHVYTNIKDWK